MKKITYVSVISLIFLLTASATTILLESASFDKAHQPLLIGIGLLIASGIVAMFAEKRIVLNILCILVSATSLGFCIRAWYIFRGFDNSFLTMALVSLACIASLWLIYALTLIPFVDRHLHVFFWVIISLGVIGYVLVVIFTQTTFVSTYGYYMIIEIAFTATFLSESNDFASTVRETTIATYSVVVVAAIIAVMMLSGGDGCDSCCDGGDCGGDGVGGSKKEKTKKDTNDSLPVV